MGTATTAVLEATLASFPFKASNLKRVRALSDDRDCGNEPRRHDLVDGLFALECFNHVFDTGESFVVVVGFHHNASA
jgi:hypothetical protein